MLPALAYSWRQGTRHAVDADDNPSLKTACRTYWLLDEVSCIRLVSRMARESYVHTAEQVTMYKADGRAIQPRKGYPHEPSFYK